MKRIPTLVILVFAPLLMAAIWLDKQPSHKSYQAPVLAPPATAVPVEGKEIISPDSVPKNPVPQSMKSVAEGAKLFDINCAMCHGLTSAERGPVGKKLNPPPPGLDQNMMKGLSDSDIFKAITFGFGRMPQFNDKLSPDERWNLVNFLKKGRL
ncbi:MAG TPA: cytochrome c [Geobacteraceae bacterium]|nr:cytochrome c [Geobacteraceae bacterium]